MDRMPGDKGGSSSSKGSAVRNFQGHFGGKGRTLRFRQDLRK